MAPAVLLVDDDEDQHDICGTLLERSGYAVVHAYSAAEALGCLQAQRDRIGVVIVDLRMPSMSGIDLIAAMRAQGVALPIVVLTADVYAAAANRPLAGSVAAWLHKPVEPRVVVATVVAILHAPTVSALSTGGLPD